MKRSASLGATHYFRAVALTSANSLAARFFRRIVVQSIEKRPLSFEQQDVDVPERAGMPLDGRRSSAARVSGQRGCDGLDFVDQHVEIRFSCSVVRDAGPESEAAID